jgi:hypothetical protein
VHVLKFKSGSNANIVGIGEFAVYIRFAANALIIICWRVYALLDAIVAWTSK